jgi:HEAT repeat protein
MRILYVLLFLGFVPNCTAFAQVPSSDELIKQLQSPEAQVRQVAAEVLGKQKVVAAIPGLEELLKDKESSVREAAGVALVRIGPKAVPAFVNALKFPEDSSRLMALRGLGLLGADSKEAVPALAAALKDKSVDVRIHAAYVLGQLKASAKPALPALFDAAKDTGNIGDVIRPLLPTSVAEAAIDAALLIDDKCGADLAKAALPVLIAALKSKDGAIVRAAGSALRQLGPEAKPALPALKEAHKDAKGLAENAIGSAIVAIGGDGTAYLGELAKDTKLPVEKRLSALSDLGWSRGRSADDKVIAILVDVLKDRDPQIRAAAVDVLSGIGPGAKAAIPPLIELLGDERIDEGAALSRPGATRVVAFALSRMGPAAVAPLADLLKDERSKPFPRWQAAMALSALGRHAKPALPVLESQLQDRFPAIAVESACAYVRAGGDIAKAMPVLSEGLKDDDALLVWHTADAIARIGPPAKNAVPALTKLLNHMEPEVRIEALHALSAMGADARPAVPEMAKILLQDKSRMRFQTARALERLGPDAKDALPALIECARDLQPKMTGHPVLGAIGNIGPDAARAVPALVDLLKQKDDIFYDDALLTLGRIGPEAQLAVPKIMDFLSNSSEFRRAAAARALGGIGPKAVAAVPALKKLLEDQRKSVRAWAMYGLARITADYKTQVPRLVELWKSDVDNGAPFSNSPRYDIAQALDLLGANARPARDILLEALQNEKTSPGTRMYAAQALGHLTADANVIVPLVVALTQRKAAGYVRISNCVYAAQCLAQLGPLAKAAAPHLRQLADDEDNDVAEAAARALLKIETK